ncbi:SCLT1 [Scenedesmus sp. PABB004]|nr:SCLT1 [Scenedesmus sp. PABB004]
MAAAPADAGGLAHPVRLVAVSGREQPVVLKIRRDGLWLFTEHGKEIQQLPYQHIVKWLPSRLRSRDRGADDCLDIQVETAAGKKDLRMRCASSAAVTGIIADIRATVQAIMADLQPGRGGGASPVKPALTPHAPAAGGSDGASFEGYARHVSDSAAASAAASPTRSATGAADAAQWEAQQRAPSPSSQRPASRRQLELPPAQEQQQAAEQQQPRDSGLPPVAPGARALPEAELALPGDDAGSRRSALLSGASLRRSTGELSEFAAGSGEAAAQISFLEDLVQRLAAELAARLDGAGAGAGGELQPGGGGEGGALRSVSFGGVHVFDSSGGAAPELPPWMRDSRFLNPLLAAYDERLAEARAELAARGEAVAGIKTKVQQLVEENEALHARLAQATARLDARSATALDGDAEDGDAARLQERLELLEQENDLLVAQQGELDVEVARLAAALADRDHQLASVSQDAARAGELEASLRATRGTDKDTGHLRAKIKVHTGGAAGAAGAGRATGAWPRADAGGPRGAAQELSDRLRDEAGRTADALRVAEAARQQAALAQAELATSQATARMVVSLQTELSKARGAAEAAGGEAAALRGEAEGLRSAVRALEGRLAEYQDKDTEVYLRIKEAMELAEEARLERDAAVSENAALGQSLAAAQAKLAEAVRQMSGGGADEPSYRELRRRAAAAEERAAAAAAAEDAAAAKLAELRHTAERLARDKASLQAELAGVREEMELTAFTAGRPGAAADRVAELERARDEALGKLDSAQRAAARAERDWELARQQLQAEAQRLAKRLAAAEDGAAAAASARAEAQQAAGAAEAELAALRAGMGRSEAELRAQMAELRAERDAEVAALVQKLERALATCDKSVVDAEQMLSAKDSLLRRWKQEAQLIASKLEVALQQHQAELAERQAQVAALTDQLAAAHEQQELLQQELDATRLTCHEAELLLNEAESRVAAAQASADAQQEGVLQELRGLQLELERAQLGKARAERARDGMAAKLGRLVMAGGSPTSAAAAAAECDGLDSCSPGSSSMLSGGAFAGVPGGAVPSTPTYGGAAAAPAGGGGIGSCRRAGAASSPAQQRQQQP